MHKVQMMSDMISSYLFTGNWFRYVEFIEQVPQQDTISAVFHEMLNN